MSRKFKKNKMKKILLVLIALFTIVTCYSQTEKGKKFIGGQLNLSNNTYSYLDTLYKSNRNSFGFQIVPNFGYFIKDNFAIGVNVNFGVSNTTQNQEQQYLPTKTTSKSNSISYGGGGFARYYKKITDNFFFFANGEVSYIYQTQKFVYSNNDPNYVYPTSDPANQEVQTNSISFDVNPGLVYFVTPKLGIQTTFGDIYYNNSTSKNISLLFDNHRNVNDYGINLNISTFYLGLNYYF